jgi:thiol-disulfide isomerase/thioredoxin
MTPYGRPVESIPLGKTELPEDLFKEFLNDIASRFAPEKYNLFTNNCNNFSNECANFLTGSGIPSHIIDLPNEVLATPMGKQLLQMMGGAGQNMMDPRTVEGDHNSQQMHLNYGPGAHELPSQNRSGGFNTNSGSIVGPLAGVQPVKELATQQDYLRELQANTAIVIDVFADWCGPCQAIKPFFAELPRQFPQIRFFKVVPSYSRWTLTKTNSWDRLLEFSPFQHSFTSTKVILSRNRVAQIKTL